MWTVSVFRYHVPLHDSEIGINKNFGARCATNIRKRHVREIKNRLRNTDRL